MPTYQYACTACGEQLEAVQAFTDAPLTECAACGGRLRKVFSAVGVVFKGSGFYKTDSRAASKSSSTETSKDSAPAASKDATPAKTDSSGSSSGSSSSSASSTSTPVAKSA